MGGTDVSKYHYVGIWHGLEYITFYVKKHRAVLAMCYNPALVRDKALGAPASVKLVYHAALC